MIDMFIIGKIFKERFKNTIEYEYKDKNISLSLLKYI
uniref:SCP-2 sterol transfer family protein n=1 Tax=Strongyloides papillosus TaxID=174720 RepID=A0A0N5C395_STREA